MIGEGEEDEDLSEEEIEPPQKLKIHQAGLDALEKEKEREYDFFGAKIFNAEKKTSEDIAKEILKYLSNRSGGINLDNSAD